ncbi:MAG: hypothetical protein WBW81_14050 [Methylocella sp.]
MEIVLVQDNSPRAGGHSDDRTAKRRSNTITKPIIERCVNRLKQFRRITRYEKTARAFVSMLCIAAARLWIETVNTA